MKALLRRYLLAATCLILLKNFLPESIYIASNPALTIAQAAGVMFILELIVRPIINIILLPINFITFGTFKWITQIIVIYGTDYLTPALTFQAFTIPSINILIAQIPVIPVSGLWIYFAIAIIIQAINNLIVWIFS